MKKLFFILLLSATIANAELYKWTDKEGTVHFSDSFEKVPPNYRNTTQAMEMDTIETSDNKKIGSHIGPSINTNNNESLTPNMGDLKNRMMNDEKIMELIRSMQYDQELKDLLSDPVILRAIQAGDIPTLLNNQDFLKILDDPRVKEIEKRLDTIGMK